MRIRRVSIGLYVVFKDQYLRMKHFIWLPTPLPGSELGTDRNGNVHEVVPDKLGSASSRSMSSSLQMLLGTWLVIATSAGRNDPSPLKRSSDWVSLDIPRSTRWRYIIVRLFSFRISLRHSAEKQEVRHRWNTGNGANVASNLWWREMHQQRAHDWVMSWAIKNIASGIAQIASLCHCRIVIGSFFTSFCGLTIHSRAKVCEEVNRKLLTRNTRYNF